MKEIFLSLISPCSADLFVLRLDVVEGILQPLMDHRKVNVIRSPNAAVVLGVILGASIFFSKSALHSLHMLIYDLQTVSTLGLAHQTCKMSRCKHLGVVNAASKVICCDIRLEQKVVRLGMISDERKRCDSQNVLPRTAL